MKYYYFLGNLNEVFTRDDIVDLTIFPQYSPLTDEQVEYYLNNPDAKRYEIEHHNDPIPELTLEEIKLNKIYEIEAFDKSSAVNEFFIGNQSL